MYNIGIDLGGTNIAAAVVDGNGKIICKASTPTRVEQGFQAIVKSMADLSRNLIEEAGLKPKDINSVGIGSPGTIDQEKGEIVHAYNLGFNHSPIREEFIKHLGLPVYIGNDANVAAYGEFVYGAGNGKYKDLVAVTLGTGLGAGIVLNGKLVCGSFNGGGELGHVVLVVDGEQCNCGRKGCWEKYSSATALIEQAKKAAEKNPSSLLNQLVENDLSKMNAKIPFDAAQQGDRVAQDVIYEYTRLLAIGVGNIINMIQPEVIVIGGGVSAQGDNLLKPLVEMVKKEVFGGGDYLNTKIMIAELGNDAGIIGAAELYRQYA
ncbi:MAG: ROK family glucokinase [Eubacteriales bacterium]|nr:ROK family glucokinase [Eubacteriales bacterium]